MLDIIYPIFLLHINCIFLHPVLIELIPAMTKNDFDMKRKLLSIVRIYYLVISSRLDD